MTCILELLVLDSWWHFRIQDKILTETSKDLIPRWSLRCQAGCSRSWKPSQKQPGDVRRLLNKFVLLCHRSGFIMNHGYLGVKRKWMSIWRDERIDSISWTDFGIWIARFCAQVASCWVLMAGRGSKVDFTFALLAVDIWGIHSSGGFFGVVASALPKLDYAIIWYIWLVWRGKNAWLQHSIGFWMWHVGLWKA